MSAKRLHCVSYAGLISAWLLLLLAPVNAIALSVFPGYVEDVVFTVTNTADSVGPIAEPFFVVESPPDSTIINVAWDTGAFAPGVSRQCRIRYRISDTLPSASYPLKIKMVSSDVEVFPREQYLVKETSLQVDTDPPVITLSPSAWFNYGASSAAFQGEHHAVYVMPGPTYSIQVQDPESYVANFQIADSSGVDISPSLVYNTTHTYTIKGVLQEGNYTLKAYSYARTHTEAPILVDDTPQVSVDTATVENQQGNFISTLYLSANSSWGLKYVKLIPFGTGASAITSLAELDAITPLAGAIQEFSSVTFSGVSPGEYYAYAVNNNNVVSAMPAYFVSATSTNPATGELENYTSYQNPSYSAIVASGTFSLSSLTHRRISTVELGFDNIVQSANTAIAVLGKYVPEALAQTHFALPSNTSVLVKTFSVYEGSATVKFNYNTSGLTSAQRAAAKLVRLETNGSYTDITDSVGSNWVSGRTRNLKSLFARRGIFNSGG